MGWFYGFKPYVSVAQRKAKAAREVAKLAKKGQTISPVKIEGRAIATTFWGKAWCDNLESYSDFESRLPRGRTYVRNGSVCDLQMAPGRVTALVCGSELYRISIEIKPLAQSTWEDVKARCAGQIASLVELLQGRLSKGVMEVVTRREGGLFPKPGEIKMKCSCPDWAGLCKHLAATLYGVGSRLDHRPELLFTLRGVDHLELIARAGDPVDVARSAPSERATIAAGDLAGVFGIELETLPPPPARATRAAKLPAPDAAAPPLSRTGDREPARKSLHKPVSLPAAAKPVRSAATGAPKGKARRLDDEKRPAKGQDGGGRRASRSRQPGRTR